MITKKYSMNYLYAFFLLFLLFCSCDPCKDVICFNGGICNDGSCQCPDAYEGPDCNIHKSPNSLKFIKIEVTNIPPLNFNGEPWDEDGSSADLVVAYTYSIGSNDYTHHASNTKENVISNNSGDLGRPLTIVSHVFSNLHTIGVYDKDEDTGAESLELICSYNWDVLQLAKETEYSSELTFSKPNCPEIRLQIEYGYPN